MNITPPLHRLLAAGGVVGPAGFITAWAVGGVAREGYSPATDAISRLAAQGASTRPLMTAGFVAFGVGVPLFAVPLRRCLRGWSWATAAGTGLATLGVAATPLDAGLDTAHALFAFAGYATLAATPLLAARPLARSGHRAWSRFSWGTGMVSAASLAATAAGPASGFFQRLGLTAGDVWIAAAAAHMVRRSRGVPSWRMGDEA